MIAVVERPTLWQRVRPVLLGFDPTLMVAVLMLCGIGLTTMYSAGYDYGNRFTDHARNMARRLVRTRLSRRSSRNAIHCMSQMFATKPICLASTASTATP